MCYDLHVSNSIMPKINWLHFCGVRTDKSKVLASLKVFSHSMPQKALYQCGKVYITSHKKLINKISEYSENQ